MSEKIKDLKEKRQGLMDNVDKLFDLADTEKRNLSGEETSKIEQLQKDIDGVDAQIRLRENQEKIRTANAMQGGKDLSAQEKKDLRSFSLGRLVRSLAEGKGIDGIEAEMVQEGQREANSCGLATRGGAMVSAKALRFNETRDMTATGGTGGDQGGMTIATQKIGLLDALFDASVLVRAGATVLNGLTGNVDLPRVVKGTAPAHKAENGAADEYTATTAQLSLAPRRLPVVLEASNQLLRQSSIPSVDRFLQNHLVRLLSEIMENKFIEGAGSGSSEPNGILGTAGIGAIFAGGAATDGTNANGAAPVWADFVNLETEVSADNAANGSLGYLLNARMIGKLKQTPRVASTDSMFILDDRAGGLLNGYNTYRTNAVPSDLTKGASGATLSAAIFGNFVDYIIAQWSGIELLVNPYSKDSEGLVRINAAIYYDGGVIRPQSFAAGDDFVTT